MEWLTTAVGGVATAFGAAATAWVFSQIRVATTEWRSRIANDALARLSDIVSTVVLDTGEVFTRTLVDALKDGTLSSAELQDALSEAAQFAWSLMRNADKVALAGGTGDAARVDFEGILKARIEAAARQAAVNRLEGR